MWPAVDRLMRVTAVARTIRLEARPQGDVIGHTGTSGRGSQHPPSREASVARDHNFGAHIDEFGVFWVLRIEDLVAVEAGEVGVPVYHPLHLPPTDFPAEIDRAGPTWDETAGIDPAWDATGGVAIEKVLRTHFSAIPVRLGIAHVQPDATTERAIEPAAIWRIGGQPFKVGRVSGIPMGRSHVRVAGVAQSSVPSGNTHWC